MSKRKHSVEWMLERVKEYLDGKGSYKTIARANGIGVRTLRGWVQKYQEQGAGGLQAQNGNFYYYERLQEGFGNRTPMEERLAALEADKPEQYPIPENKRIQKYKAKFAA